MIILKPTTNNQTFSIYPRLDDDTRKYVVIRRDDTGEIEMQDYVFVEKQSYYFDATLASNILVEGNTYTIEFWNLDSLSRHRNRIVSEGNQFQSNINLYMSFKDQEQSIWYRDKIYVTAQDDFTIKHKYSQNIYTQYDSVDDNTYII